MRMIKEIITISVSSSGTTGTTTKVVPSGRIVGMYFTVPTLDGVHTAKFQIADYDNSALIYVPDTAVGSGTCASATTSILRPTTDSGEYYPLFCGINGVSVLVTVSTSQNSTDTYTLTLIIET